MAHCLTVCAVDVHQLASIVRNHIDNALILDSRSFLEFNSSHVVNAINVGCAKLMKRRLQQEKLSIQNFLAQNCHWEVDKSIDIIVYDQSSQDAICLPIDSFMAVFLQKLLPVYNSVNILKGGFLEFQAAYPNLCEDEKSKFAPLTSLSQPCLSISNHGPTRILPFLYLGSQHDSLNKETLQNHNIAYELNVSTNCPKPDFIQESHFLRIPVIDNYSEKLLPHFPRAFQFLDKVRESGGCVLIHCLAGISRSATVAIAYLMRTLRMSSDEAYRYVKAKRATISPNFNFLGQLLEYENQLLKDTSEGQRCKNDYNITCAANSSQSFTDKTGYYKRISNSYISTCVADPTEKSVCSVMNFSETATTKNCYFSLEKVHSKEISDAACIPDGQTAALSIKCVSVSSLKELSFTPCQTSAFTKAPLSKLTVDQHSLESSCEMYYDTIPSNKTNSTCFLESSLNLSNSDKKCDCSLFENTANECKLETGKNLNDFSPDFNIKSFEFYPKIYNRSDSLSTSGLGSEGSDCADSWNDYQTS